jgi:hypothetical protein
MAVGTPPFDLSSIGFSLWVLGLARTEVPTDCLKSRESKFATSKIKFSVPFSFLCVLCVMPLHFARQVKGLTQWTQRKEEGTERRES